MAVANLTEKIIFTPIQKEVLDGAMLGDGCLYLHTNAKNAQLVYTSKSRQHVEYVGEYFQQYWSGEGIKNSSYLDKRTNKIYYSSTVKTYTNESFTKEYNRWYSNGIKHLPNDLILTPLTCLIWYIGDGGICHTNRSENIKLSTHCFIKEEQEKILLPQLKQFEPHLCKADKEEQYYIYIPHKKEKEFLEYIGECPFSDYTYKWNYAKYKNAMPQDHTSHEQEFCELYLSGMTYYAIGKKFNIEPNAVKYYLIKNGIYQSLSEEDKKFKNAVIQYEQDKIIAVYASGAAAEKTLHISSSGISQVCKGSRNNAGGFQWKRFKDVSIETQQYIKNNLDKYFK
jgi:hypothetical protein